MTFIGTINIICFCLYCMGRIVTIVLVWDKIIICQILLANGIVISCYVIRGRPFNSQGGVGLF